MAKPEGPALCIIIADNDPEGSARPIVDEFIAMGHIPVYYEVEARQGIPFARNKVLNTARIQGVTELAFIDDDEYVDARWLTILWDYYCTRKVDVVWGWVKMVYPAHTPEWIVDGHIFQLPKNKTGMQYYTAYTNNVLFNFTKIVNGYGIYFDENCGSFGEDEDFFMRAANHGVVIHYLAEAVVFEPLDDKRMKVAYYLKRLFYNKNNKIIFRGQNFRFRFKMLSAGFIDFPKGIVCFMLALLTGKTYRLVQGIGFLVTGTAKILGFCGIHLKWD